ncbi:MAG: hypothetical protein C3F02_02610 [Parcubacteria group bacterium]|nr:MAG: hypothetical protein C3F02_02610 [Parcubacteria group bacterium]
MSTFFFILLLISLICLIIGLINPSVFQKITKTVSKRKTITLFCLGWMFISFIGIGIFAPKVELKKDIKIEANNTEQQIRPQIAVDESTTTPSNLSASDNNIPSQTTGTDIDKPGVPTIPPSAPTNQPYEYYSVSSVVDGDTIKVNIGGTVETLRLIGMDTPEVVDPRKPVQCFGKEASNKAKELLIGKKVRIEKDPTQGEFDKYNRRLAYIYREDGLFYNKYMIEQGYAHEYTYNTPYKYQNEFKAAQKYAHDNNLGLWSPDTCNGDTTQSVTTPAPSQNNPANQTSDKYYTSSYGGTKYYYPEACSGWKSLSAKYLKAFDSLEALLRAYPSRTLSPQCQ